jgi:hypothetical protein
MICLTTKIYHRGFGMINELLNALEVICEATELNDGEKMEGVKAVLVLNKVFDKLDME